MLILLYFLNFDSGKKSIAKPGSLDQLPGIPGALFILVRSPKLRWSQVSLPQQNLIYVNKTQSHGKTTRGYGRKNSTHGKTAKPMATRNKPMANQTQHPAY